MKSLFILGITGMWILSIPCMFIFLATTTATAKTEKVKPKIETAGYAKVKCNRALKNTGVQGLGWDWSYFKIEVSTMSNYSYTSTSTDYEYVVNFTLHHKGLGLTKLVSCIYDVKSKKLIDLAEY